MTETVAAVDRRPATPPVEVDLIVPVRDEIDKLPEFLAMVGQQTLQPRRIIIADGMSTDGSRDLLARAAVADPRIVVLDNHQRVVPTALNLALSRVESPLVARMDTHALYAPDYLEQVTRVFGERPDVWGVGGAMDTRGRGPWGEAIASTLRRPFGLGGARHRVGGAAGPIGHVFSGAYRTDRLREIHGWDPQFHANEDFEADTRLREAGGELWLETAATSTWFVRESPRALAIQMWRYGYFKALTLRLHPDSLQPRQLVPPALVGSLLIGGVLRPRATGLGLLAYLTAAGALGGYAAHRDGHSVARGIVVPPVVHLSWGAGLLAGTVPAARADVARPTREVTS